MSAGTLKLIELGVLFAALFGFCFYQLHALNKLQRDREREREHGEQGRENTES